MKKSLAIKCFHCKEDVGTVYDSDGHWLCLDCWEDLREEKMLIKKKLNI